MILVIYLLIILTMCVVVVGMINEEDILVIPFAFILLFLMLALEVMRIQNVG